MPPNTEPTPVQTAPVPPTHVHGIAIFLGVVPILLSCALVAALVSAFYTSKKPVETAQSGLIAYFPRINPNVIKPDPDNADYLWMSSGAGISRINIKTNELRTYTPVEIGVENRAVMDFAKSGNNLFIGTQGGLAQYNLETGEKKFYTKDNGLASNSNLHPVADPSDSDTVWIGTFEGLSVLTVSTGVIRSFDTDIGITGSAREVRIFGVDGSYVWVNINSNSYTTGGVARFNKKTGQWKAWNKEFFMAGDSPTRFDSFNTVSDGENAFVVDDYILYQYKPQTDSWDVAKQYVRGESDIPQMIALRGSALYLRGEGIEVRDIQTGAGTTLASTKSAGVQYWNRVAFSFDKARGRIIVYPREASFLVPVFIVDAVADSIIPVAALALAGTSPLPNAYLSDATGTLALLTTRDGMFTYDWTTQRVTQLSSTGASVARFAGDSVVALDLASCDMYCREESLVATSTIFSLTGEVRAVATIRGTTTDLYHIGTSINDVYVFTNSRDKAGAYHLTDNGNSFEYVTRPVAAWNPDPAWVSTGDSVDYASADGAYNVLFTRRLKGDAITVSVRSADGTSKEIVAPVGEAEYSHWGWESDVYVASFAYSKSNPHVLWIGTDRGLIRADLETGSARTYTTHDGLSANSIQNIKTAPGVVLLDQPTGVYIYSESMFR